jgi:hypothetical protein
MIKMLIDEKLMYGVGVSITSNNWKYVNEIANYTPNFVAHLILGIHKPDILEHLEGRKVLLLGYKDFGFGIDYHKQHPEVDTIISEWYRAIHPMIGKRHLSFDNLAIEQLNLRRCFTDKGWSKFYMGDDATYTMYIDAVMQKYAPTSRSNDRVSFDEMDLLTYFNKLRNGKLSSSQIA